MSRHLGCVSEFKHKGVPHWDDNNISGYGRSLMGPF